MKTRIVPTSTLLTAFVLSAQLAHAQTAAPVAAPPPAEPPAADAASPAAPATPNAESTAPAAQPDAPVAPAQSAPAAADAEADAAAAAAEAELQSGGATDPGSEFKLNLYGFADFTYSIPWSKNVGPSSNSTFAVGKLNLYAAADLGDDWRSLAEIRFMYLPNGNTGLIGSTDPRTNTTVGDYTDVQRAIRWGGISIERAWLEHTFHPLLTVRAGQWLTPYGIWNVDHGSPVILGVRRPYVVGEELLPQYQTGIEAYGSAGFGPHQIGYHLTLSNGRGPVDTYQDLDKNKAVGARLFYKHDGDLGIVTVGASAYRGQYTNAHDDLAVGADGSVTFPRTIDERYDELSLAADAKWEWEGLLLQGELVTNDRAYADPGRPPLVLLSGGPAGFTPDHRRLGGYVIGGYRTPWLGIMPWVGTEYYDPGIHAVFKNVWATFIGLNVRPTARVVLKAQHMHVWFPDSALGTLDSLEFQAAWSF